MMPEKNLGEIPLGSFIRTKYRRVTGWLKSAIFDQYLAVSQTA